MIKLFTVAAVSATALVATAGIAAEPAKTFVHNGITYVYDATPATDGGILLTGYIDTTGQPFRLVIKDGKVSGSANRRPVSFSVRASRGAADGAVVADRAARVSSAD